MIVQKKKKEEDKLDKRIQLYFTQSLLLFSLLYIFFINCIDDVYTIITFFNQFFTLSIIAPTRLSLSLSLSLFYTTEYACVCAHPLTLNPKPIFRISLHLLHNFSNDFLDRSYLHSNSSLPFNGLYLLHFEEKK